MKMDSLEALAACFKRLPGVGHKSAMRYAYSIIEADSDRVEAFAKALLDVKNNIRLCKVCGNYTEDSLCEICINRDKSTICVVKAPRDIIALEKMGEYKGVYHCLHGTIDFQKGVSVDDIRLKELLSRLDGVKEIIIALDADISGEMTSAYLAGLIKPLGIKVSRIAHGIPMGSEIEYTDEITLQKALRDRKDL